MFDTNPIHIDQGSSWFLNLTLLDDELYKSRLLDFIMGLSIPYDIKSTLIIILGYDISKKDFMTVCENLIAKHLSHSELTVFYKIFKTSQLANIEDYSAKLYIRTFRSSSSTKTIDISVDGVLQKDSTFKFELTPDQTYSLIYSRNKEFDTIQRGSYTIEITENSINRVDKVLEGDVLVYRTNKKLP